MGEPLLPEVTLLLNISETARSGTKRRAMYYLCQGGSSCSRKSWMDGRMDEQKDGCVGEGLDGWIDVWI